MNVGLPGTGIGGLFYLMLVMAMPMRELWLTARGRGSARGWRSAGLYGAMAACIFAALWSEAWLIQQGITWLAARPGAIGQGLAALLVRGHALPDSGRLVALGSVLTLASVLLAATVWSYARRMRATPVPVKRD